MRRALVTLVCAVVLAGCGGGRHGGAAADGSGTSSAAATLRSRLAAALQSQAYLSGAAALAGARNGFASRTHEEALATLAGQVTALEGAVVAAVGPAPGASVADRATSVNAALDRYAKARTDGDARDAATAIRVLGRARARESGALAAAGTGLSAQQIDALQVPQLTLQRGAIDALVANTASASAELFRASSSAATLAVPLSESLARRAGGALKGDPDGAASTLRALLTVELGDHAHLVGTVSREIIGQGAASPSAIAAHRTLRDEATLLEETVGASWGQEARLEFSTIWRRHLAALEAYALAESRVDDASARVALNDLDTFRTDIVGFFVRRCPKLTASEVRGPISAYLDDATATTRAFAAGSPQAFGRFQDTADRMPPLAALLAQGIAAQFPDRFPGD